MYNFRYHIASLVAVFLALALGLVLGGLVVQQGGFESQQKALVASLQKDFNGLKKESSALKTALSVEQRYSAQMTGAWVAGRLSGKNVLIITSPAKDEGLSEAVAAVKAAGGNAPVVTIARKGLGLSDSQVASAVVSAIGTPTADVRSAVVQALMAEWTQPDGDRPLTDALVSAGSIKLSAFDASVVATQVIDLAAFDGTPDAVGLSIAQAYAAAGMYAVGAETPTSDTGVAAAAASHKLSAFDTLGTNPGTFTLVALFSGGEQGYYSTAPQATAAFPPVPTP